MVAERAVRLCQCPQCYIHIILLYHLKIDFIFPFLLYARREARKGFNILVKRIISRRREVPAVFISIIHKLKYKAMKEFMNIWIEPFQEKGLNRHEKFVIGVVVPAAFVAVVILSHLLP